MAHIPQSPTCELELKDFHTALREAVEPNPGYDSSRWLYVPNAYSEYRYVLGTIGQRPLICMGINPSTAAPDDLDNTLKSVQRIALHNGFDSFLMFNVYAQRATDPDSMERSCNMTLHRENLEALRYLLSRSTRPAVWAAWGAIIEKRDYLAACLADQIALSREFDARWYTAGPISRKGHPHHPLYLRKDAALDPFDPERYCREVLKLRR